VPIVLILLGAALQAVLVFKDWEQVRWGTLLILAGGFAGALAASTTFHAMPMGLAPRAAAIFAAHEKYASYTLWLSGITLLLRGIGQFFKLQRRAYEILVLGFALAAAGALSVAGHRGAQLVYVEGVGPQGHLVMKGHHHDEGGTAATPSMEMEAGGHADKQEAAEHHEAAAPEQSPQTEKPHSANMAGMDMSGPKPNRSTATSGVMPAMPGMKMPTSKTSQEMPQGMKMNRSASPNQQKDRPGMGNMPGMKGQSAESKKPDKTHPGMKGMANMPGMKSLPAAQPAPTMGNMADMPGMSTNQATPATGSMPGMAMPNPLDKFRFKDNNPARNQPAPKN
jgi:uncharacterized membrane protein